MTSQYGKVAELLQKGDIMSWKDDATSFYAFDKSLAKLSILVYLADGQEYEKFARSKYPDEKHIPFSKELIRQFAASLKRRGLSDCTVERKIHGVLALWEYFHYQNFATNPCSFRELSLRLKCGKNPTPPMSTKDYQIFMRRAYAESQRIY